MFRWSWLCAALVGLVGLLTVNAWAFVNYVYWTHRWTDIPMHLAGGLIVGIFLVGFLRDYRPTAFFMLVLVFAVGWEVFEFLFNIAVEGSGRTYVLDTASDLANGAVGATLAYFLARKTVWHLR